MPKIKTVTVTAEQQSALERGAKYGSTPSFRLRCQAILLKCDPGDKNQERTSLSVAEELGCCEMSVNDWMARFSENGVDGLAVKVGRGRKPILRQETDLPVVERVVADNRQRLRLAKAELEQELGKEFGLLTLKRFLKKTVAVTSASGG